jgi:hypothetical protein
MKQAFFCELCKEEMTPVPPPFPPQVQNGVLMSTVAMLNGHAECPNCGAKYSTQIMAVQLNLGLVRIKEESKIVVPTMVPPKLNLK